MSDVQTAERTAMVRSFNRFYTQRVGVLREGLLESEFSLTEVRVLQQISSGDRVTAAAIGRELGLDGGYLSRLLRRLETKNLIARARSNSDGRRSHLTLTDEGRSVFADLDARADDEIAAMLGSLTDARQLQLLQAMATIRELLGRETPSEIPYILRPPHAGDLGWVVHRHGALYARENGWDERFEGLVAGVVADFTANFDAKRERCWIAERKGEIVGSVFLVKKTDTIAKLRLLLVEPSARGLGIGRRLVSECTRFARQVGYERIVLWTNSTLVSARRIYQAEGYTLVSEERHDVFNEGELGQTWELVL